MRHTITLESIGDNTHAVSAGLKKLGMPFFSRPKPWVALIIGMNAKWGFTRVFLDGQRDYSKANSVGSRGVRIFYFVSDGVYEVQDPLSWSRTDRYFLHVVNGRGERIGKDDVEQCLTGNMG